MHENLIIAMRQNNWPVTFSAGVVTFETPPTTSREALNVADKMMYSVKHYHKNSVVYKIWREGNELL